MVARKVNNAKANERHSAGRPSASEAATRIGHLLDVAAEVFMEKGYEGASVGEIASRANASKQTLYSRYPTKAELFTAVMSRRCEEGLIRFTDILQSNVSVADVLKSFAEELIRSSLDQRWTRLLRTIIGTAETFPELGQTFWRIGPERALEIISQFLAERMKKHELRKDDPLEAAHLFLTMCSGRFWLRDLLGIHPRVTPTEVEQYTREVVQIFLSIYKPAR